MKKVVVALTLVVALMVSAVIPVAAAESVSGVMPAFQPDCYSAQFAYDLDTASAAAGESLADPTPFWVDIVDAELYPDGGEGIYVAVLDTGLLDLWPFFFPHANIADEWGIGFTHDIWWDDILGDIVFGPLRDDRGFITKPYEGSGHGTHVTSTIVGYNFNNLFIVGGVAPKATIIPVLCMDAWEVPYPGGTLQLTGGTDEMVAAGINYVAELAEREGIKIIINMSLGGPEPTAMIEDAIDYAISKGVIVVASAGNEGYAGMGWPGAYDQVISAGAGGWTEQWVTRPPQTRWWLNDVTEKLNTKDYWGNNWQIYLEDFSSRPNKDLGQKSFYLDVTDPGASVVGPYKGYFSTAVGYYYLWGTSMAAPHVSGIAAMVLGEHPDLGQRQMEFVLKIAALGIPLCADGAWVYDPFYAVDPGVYPWHFEWSGKDYGAGWLTADKAMRWADVLSRVFARGGWQHCRWPCY
jgi:subtilisin family serine protease